MQTLNFQNFDLNYYILIEINELSYIISKILS